MRFMDAALALADSGLPVFGLRPKRKKPRFKGSFHDAMTNLDEVAAHWRKYPYDNIGVRPPVGIVVVDVDPRSGGDLALAALEREHGRLPATWTARTGSDGRHFWFTVSGDVDVRGKLCDGVDLKHGGSGYVVAPPSVHPDGGVYEWMTPPEGFPAAAPDWLRHRMERPPIPPPGSHTPTGVRGNGPYTVGCLVGRITKAAVGDRNRVLYGAVRDALRQGDLDAYEADLVAAAASVGLSSREVASTLRSARGGAE